MRSKLITLVFVAFLSKCSARALSQKDISSILQDIMSPDNTDKAMQLINMAASKANKRIAIPDISNALAASNEYLPARLPPGVIARDNMPGRIIVNEMGLPVAVITNDGVIRRILSEPKVIGPEVYSTQRPMVRQIVRDAAPGLVESIMLPEVYQSRPVGLPQENAVYPCGSPGRYPNPFLPVAPMSPNLTYGAPNPYLPLESPMSAMSQYLPLPTQSKGQFLRKIPIPPPTL